MLKLVDDAAEGREEVVAGLDEIAREGARRMLAAALRAEADAYVEMRWPRSSMRRGGGWWCATGTPRLVRSPRWPAQCRCVRHG